MLQQILNNQVLVYFIMAVAIFALTQGLKWILVKPWTNKIKNEKARKAVNTTIYFIPYALGCLFEFMYSVMLLHGEFNAVMGIIHGTSGIACYGLFERFYSFITGKSSNISNPYEQTEVGKAVKELMDSIAEDGKVDKADHPALEAFLQKVR
jgi:hypothetical protein